MLKNFRATHWMDDQTGELRDDLIPMLVPKKRSNGFNTRWFAMSQEAVDYIAENIKSLDDYRVFMKLTGRLDFENLISISQTELADELNMKQPNVSRSIRRLKELSILLEGPAIGRSKTYRLNPSIGWKGSAKNHRVALQKRASDAGLSVIQGGSQ